MIIINSCKITGKALDSCKNLTETETRASCGHSWNQLMAVLLVMAGNLRERTRSVEPTGEKQSTTFSWRRTRSMKNFQQFSRVSSIPAPFTWNDNLKKFAIVSSTIGIEP